MTNLKIKIDRDRLMEEIKKVIERAEGWESTGGSGECQLYGKYDDEGYVYDFFVADFAGHNSWIQGENIICLFVQRWFNWHDHEHLGEWLEGELDRDPETRVKFIEWLKENDCYNDERGDNRNIYYNWDKFEEFDEEKWSEYMERWREVWMDVRGWEMIQDELKAIAEDEGIELI